MLIAVEQGQDDSSVVYTSGCSDDTCLSARPQTSLVRLRGGCSEISVRFVDAGAAFKWLRVSARSTRDECRGAPRYPACNTVTRRLLTPAVEDAAAWAAMRADPGDSVDVAGARRLADVAARAAAVSRYNQEASEGPRSVSGYDIEREAAEEGAGGDDAEEDVSDDEVDDRADLDADVDASCSVFKVRFLPAN